MSLDTKFINGIQVFFDRKQTSNDRNETNQPCDCQWCRNYYANIDKNTELTKFLSEFGIDYNYSDEIFSFELNEDKTLVHHICCYHVIGKINGEDFSLDKYGVKITFEKGESFPPKQKSEFFWIKIETDFPYMIDK